MSAVAKENEEEIDFFACDDGNTLKSVETLIQEYEKKLPPVASRIGQKVDLHAPRGDNSSASELGHSLLISDATIVGESAIPGVVPPPTLREREPADIWVIGTERASRMRPNALQYAKIAASRWNGNGWDDLTLDEFFTQQTEDQHVLLYVHGNRTSRADAVAHGMCLLRSTLSPTPTRLVIWCWDSDRVSHRPREEYITKAIYSDYQGFYLANFLQSLRNERGSVTLVGHSFGVRTILCAYHLLAGGSYAGRKLDSSAVLEQITLPTSKLVLIAAATGHGDLQTKGKFGLALDLASQVVVTRNDSDPALRFYPKMAPKRSRLPDAMGYVGVSRGDISDENWSKIQTIPMAYPSHKFLDYISMRSVKRALALEVE